MSLLEQINEERARLAEQKARVEANWQREQAEALRQKLLQVLEVVATPEGAYHEVEGLVFSVDDEDGHLVLHGVCSGCGTRLWCGFVRNLSELVERVDERKTQCDRCRCEADPFHE